MSQTTFAQVARKLEIRASNIKRGIALDLLRRVSRMTPRDTGWASANWHVHVGKADPTLTPPQRPQQGSRALPLPSAPPIGFVPPGVPLHVSNPVHYIGFLNNGSSVQAPAGFIQQAVTEAVHAAPTHIK